MRTTPPDTVWSAWHDGGVIAVLDVRDEAEHALGHPLFAASLAIDKIELEIYDRIPCRFVPIVCLDDGDGRAERAAVRIRELGYRDVSVLDGGIDGWRAAGRELFADVNSPSKAFGELVEATCRPDLLAPDDLLRRIERGEEMIIVDGRRFDEFVQMSIPGARNVPNGELVYRVESLVDDPAVPIIVNCAGRTRSIIGAQTLRNVGIANPVAALRNGTIGWTLAGHELNHGARLRFDLAQRPSPAVASAARALAQRCGVVEIDATELASLRDDGELAVYFLDVRETSEYLEGHLRGFGHAPGGQLVQESDHFIPVRGAKIVLADNDGVRASVTGSWLAQMGWSVMTITIGADRELDVGPAPRTLPSIPQVRSISPPALAARLHDGTVEVIDLSSSTSYRSGHVPGAAFALRRELPSIVEKLGPEVVVVLTSEDGMLARIAASDLAMSGRACLVLDGGVAAWEADQLPLDRAELRWMSQPTDRYRRPYEGTDVDPSAMEAYLEWEYGLVAQLQRDGSHRFSVLCGTQ